AEFLVQKAGGSRRPPSKETVENKEHYVFQEGSTVFKFAVNNMSSVGKEIMEKNKLTSDDIAFLVSHQANKRIIDATAERMGIAPDKILVNILRYGNTTNSSIPLLLWDYEKKFKKGDNIVMAAF